MNTAVRRTNRRLPVLIGILIAATAVMVIVWRNYLGTIDDRLHGDSDEAHAALNLVLKSTPKAGVVPLLTRLLADSSPGLRLAALDNLIDLHNPATANTVENAFRDNTESVRETALYGLYTIDPNRGMRLLLAALRDNDTQIRESAATAIMTHADKLTVPALIAALDDPDRAVADIAMGTLRRITGEPFVPKAYASEGVYRQNIDKWKAWWRLHEASWPVDEDNVDVASIEPTRIDPSPEFRIVDIDRRPLTLERQRGRITILNFWGTWCPECQSELPGLVQLQRDDAGLAVDAIGIAVQEPNADYVRSWCLDRGITYRMALADDSILDAFGDIHQVPVTVLIDTEGRIRNRWDGPVDYPTLRTAVSRIIGG